MIVSNSDEAIGKKIADAMQKVGKEGVIAVEEGSGGDSRAFFMVARRAITRMR